MDSISKDKPIDKVTTLQLGVMDVRESNKFDGALLTMRPLPQVREACYSREL